MCCRDNIIFVRIVYFYIVKFVIKTRNGQMEQFIGLDVHSAGQREMLCVDRLAFEPE